MSVSGPVLSPWPALHQQFNVALLQLESVVSNLENVPDATQSAVVYPFSTFPSHAMGGLLTTLLRKKNLPEVEKWIEEGQSETNLEGVEPEDDDEFSQWALETAERLTKISVRPVRFDARASSGGWPLEKTIEFMAGQV